MQNLLSPRSIAVVGASPQGVSRGTGVIRNLQRCGYAGDVFAVNPKYSEIEGVACFPSIVSLPRAVDCLVVAINAEAALDVLEAAFAKGTRAAVILSAGFGEGGREPERLARLQALASNGMQFCGPNCFGLHNLRSRAAMFSGRIDPAWPVGSVAMVSQSGGMVTYIAMPLMVERGIGFGYLVSCGNQVGTTIEDYLEAFVDDPDIRVAAVYLEGIQKPEKFRQVALRALEREKPIIALTVGRSQASRAAVVSHTGSLAPRPEILSAFLRQCGVLQARGLTEACELIEMLATSRRRSIGRKLFVFSASGGEAALTADHMADADLEPARFSQRSADRLSHILPDFGTIGNPIDPTGALFQDRELFSKVISTVLDDADDSVLAVSINARGAAHPMMRSFAEQLGRLAQSASRPVVAFSPAGTGGILDPHAIEHLHAAGVPMLSEVGIAMHAIARVHGYWDAIERSKSPLQPFTVTGAPGAKAPVSPGLLSFMQACEMMKPFGLPFAPTVLVQDEAEAVAAAARVGYPVVVKADAVGLAHRSEAGCVRINCSDANAVRIAFTDVVNNAQRAGHERLYGVLIQPMVPAVVEAIAGVQSDPALGPAIVFGLGGIFTEILRDVTIECAPVTADVARSMIAAIKASQVLHGARGRPQADVAALVDLLVGLSNFALTYKDSLDELDLNPIMVGPAGAGVSIVDALVRFRSPDR
jgi:acetyltransferase